MSAQQAVERLKVAVAEFGGKIDVLTALEREEMLIEIGFFAVSADAAIEGLPSSQQAIVSDLMEKVNEQVGWAEKAVETFNCKDKLTLALSRTLVRNIRDEAKRKQFKV